jgi:hypothetical protein
MLPLTVYVIVEHPGLGTLTLPETSPPLDVRVHEYPYESFHTFTEAWFEISVTGTGLLHAPWAEHEDWPFALSTHTTAQNTEKNRTIDRNIIY